MKIDRKNMIVVVCMIIAVLSRVVGLGSYPGGVHVDEAYAGYESWAMLNYGMDSWGMHNPVYLIAWGSGMNVLNSILMMPFIKIWGLNEVTIRLPQVILGIISVYVFYLFLRKAINERVALVGLFLLSICPWHIMMSRWGLESNLAPGMLLMAAYFFMLGIEKRKYFILSAVFWGLSLYCYATVWILVPSLIGVWILYCFLFKKINFSWKLIAAGGILLLLACPLLLFLAVNIGWIPEIKTAYITIPKLVFFRVGELSISNIGMHIKALLNLIVHQSDGIMWNAIPYFGMYYLFSLPFIVVGIGVCIKRIVTSFISRKFCNEFFVFSWFVIALCVGILQGVDIIKTNYCHISVIMLWAIGVEYSCRKLSKWICGGVILSYLISFLLFLGYYFTQFQSQICVRQLEGAGEAINAALEMYETQEFDAICATAEMRHPSILFYTQWPLDNYLETVTWQRYPDIYLCTASFGCFVWRDASLELDNDFIYIIENKERSRFESQGWTIDWYDCVGVAYNK